MLASLLTALLVASPAAAPSPKTLLDQAITRFDSLDDEHAAPLLRAVLARHPAGEIAAKAHLYLGLIALNAVKPDDARQEFREALAANSLIELPVRSSPKVQQFFENVRRSPREERDSAPTGGTTDVPAAALSLDSAAAPAESRGHALSFVLGGVGLACAAAAIVGAVEVVEFNSYASQVNQGTASPVPTWSQANGQRTTAQVWQIIAFAAGAAAVGTLGAGLLTW